MNQDCKCFFGLHKYEIIREEEIRNRMNEVVEKIIIQQCKNCGKLYLKRFDLTPR